MNQLTKVIAASLVSLAISSPTAFALPNPSFTGFHPYFCDADSNNPMTVGFVNDHHHRLYLQVTVPQENINFDCENAGALVRFSSKVPFQSISVWLKTAGDIDLCNDIDIFFNVCGNPNAVCLTEATKGRTTPDGFTEWTLDASKIGFLNSPLTAAGIAVARHPDRADEGRRPGKVGILKFAVNGVFQTTTTTTENACPFSSCY